MMRWASFSAARRFSSAARSWSSRCPMAMAKSAAAESRRSASVRSKSAAAWAARACWDS